MDAILDYETKSGEQINALRKESTESAKQIEGIVEDGKRRYAETIHRFVAAP